MSRLQDRLFIERDRVRLLIPESDHSVIVVPKKARKGLIRSLHDSQYGGHHGRDQTQAQLESRYYWPTLSQDARKYVQSCDPCQRANSSGDSWFTMKPFTIEAPWSVVHLDLMEMETSAEGHTHILVIRCGSSIYTDMYALRGKEKAEVITSLRECFSHYGPPGSVITDEGGEFQNHVFSEFLISLKVAHRTVTPEAHHANGTAERAVQEIRAYCKKYEVDEFWNEMIPYIRYNMNSRILSRLGNRSPSEVLQGRRFLHPLDLEAGISFAPINLRETEQKLMVVRQDAAKQLEMARRKMKDRHEKKRGRGPKHEALKAGDFVYIRSDDETRGHKNRPQWFGPVTLTRVALEGKRCYYLDTTEPDQEIERVVPATRVKRCVVRDLEWMDTPIVEEPVEEVEEEPKTIPETSEASVQQSSHSSPLPRGYYVINEIISARGVVGKTREYRVSWEGYGPEENTWEPEGNLPKRTVTEAIAHNGFPDNLPKDVVSYPLHIKEVISIQKILNTRKVGARTFLILMNGDPSERLTKVDVEYMPTECLTHHDIWSSQEIFRQGCAVFNKFRGQ